MDYLCQFVNGKTMKVAGLSQYVQVRVICLCSPVVFIIMCKSLYILIYANLINWCHKCTGLLLSMSTFSFLMKMLFVPFACILDLESSI